MKKKKKKERDKISKGRIMSQLTGPKQFKIKL